MTGVLRELFQTLYPHADLIVPIFWVGFFAAAVAAIFGKQRRELRRAFVVIFFVGLLFFNTVAPVALLPYVDWHKFSSPRPQESQFTSMRLVDEYGNEYDYPAFATLNQGHASLSAIESGIVSGRFSAERQEAIARHLILEAEQFRDQYHTNPWRIIRYPPHGIKQYNLDSAGQFVGIRIYRVNRTTSADGTEITEREEELVVELTPELNQTESPTAGGPSSMTAPSLGGGR